MLFISFLCMFAYSDVQHFVLSNVLTFCVPCCDIFYDFHMEMMFGSSLPPVVCRRAHALFTLFAIQHIMAIWVAWRVSYKGRNFGHCLSFCVFFPFGHCNVCPSNDGFWIPLWYLQTSLFSPIFILTTFTHMFSRFLIFILVTCPEQSL
jgi:hypothetical protein